MSLGSTVKYTLGRLHCSQSTNSIVLKKHLIPSASYKCLDLHHILKFTVSVLCAEQRIWNHWKLGSLWARGLALNNRFCKQLLFHREIWNGSAVSNKKLTCAKINLHDRNGLSWGLIHSRSAKKKWIWSLIQSMRYYKMSVSRSCRLLKAPKWCFPQNIVKGLHKKWDYTVGRRGVVHALLLFEVKTLLRHMRLLADYNGSALLPMKFL